jgi:hypothetical protein
VKIVIDVTEAKFLLVLNPQRPPEHYIEGDATVSRTYSALTLAQLQRLYSNTTGHALSTSDYSAALQTCKHLAVRLVTMTGGSAYDLEKEDG